MEHSVFLEQATGNTSPQRYNLKLTAMSTKHSIIL